MGWRPGLGWDANAGAYVVRCLPNNCYALEREYRPRLTHMTVINAFPRSQLHPMWLECRCSHRSCVKTFNAVGWSFRDVRRCVRKRSCDLGHQLVSRLAEHGERHRGRERGVACSSSSPEMTLLGRCFGANASILSVACLFDLIDPRK